MTYGRTDRSGGLLEFHNALFDRDQDRVAEQGFGDRRNSTDGRTIAMCDGWSVPDEDRDAGIRDRPGVDGGEAGLDRFAEGELTAGHVAGGRRSIRRVMMPSSKDGSASPIRAKSRKSCWARSLNRTRSAPSTGGSGRFFTALARSRKRSMRASRSSWSATGIRYFVDFIAFVAFVVGWAAFGGGGQFWRLNPDSRCVVCRFLCVIGGCRDDLGLHSNADTTKNDSDAGAEK